MTLHRAMIYFANRTALAAALAAALLTSALAQEQPPPAGAEQRGFIATIDRWFAQQAGNLATTFKDAGKQVETFGDTANDAARTTYKGAKDTADAVVRIPGTRVVEGHVRCEIAANGAPDCNAAAAMLCKSQGLGAGKSLDMTTAEVCPAEVYLAGRRSGPGCTTDTFVSRAVCQ